MPQTSKISRNNTRVYKDDQGRISEVWLHNTCILEVDWDDRIASVCTGGWPTVTTQARMNQAFNELGLPFYASRRGGVFTVGRRQAQDFYYLHGSRRVELEL